MLPGSCLHSPQHTAHVTYRQGRIQLQEAHNLQCVNDIQVGDSE